jgi:hypothetical protein
VAMTMSRMAPPPPTDAPPDDERRHRWPGRLGTIAVVLFVAALLISAAIFVFVPRPDARHPGGGVERVATGGSVCGLPAGDQTIPTTTPPDTTWQLLGTMAAPTDPRLGPGRIGAGLPFCYSRSPMGALYAAANFIAVLSDPSLRLPAAKYLTAAGRGREELIRQSTSPGGPGSSDMQLGGFVVAPNYTPDTASVDLAIRYGRYFVRLQVPLRWESGDWRVVVPDNGRPLDGMSQIPDLSNYVPWAGR